jgi:hypothetical protein
MARSCPISFKQIDGTIARINAVFITLLVILFSSTSANIILYILALDFAIRLSKFKKYSPIANFSKFIKKLLKLKTKMTDAAAKKLAAFFGLFFIVIMAFLSNMGLNVALYTTTAILLTCSSLEVFFNYCLGCEIYHLYKKLFYKKTTQGVN